MRTTGWVAGLILVVSLGACGEVDRGGSSGQQLGPSAVTGPSAPAASAPPPSSSTPGSSSGSEAATLQSLSISPSTIRQQGHPTGVVTFTAAIESAASVALETGNNELAKVPATVTVEANSATASFTIDTASVAADTAVTITARYGGISRTATLTIVAGAPADNRPGPTPPTPSNPTPTPTPSPAPKPTPTPTPTPSPTPTPTPTPSPKPTPTPTPTPTPSPKPTPTPTPTPRPPDPTPTPLPCRVECIGAIFNPLPVVR